MELMDYDICKLLEKAKLGRKIIAFGAGKFLESFCNRYNEYELERYIYKIIDNNVFLVGKNKKIGMYDIPVVGVEEGIQDLEDGIILITTLYLDEVAQQLSKYNIQQFVFLGYVIDRFIEQEMKSRESRYDIVNDVQYCIPKIIHYCWFGKEKLPDRYKEWMKTWKKYCPDYEIVEWNESNYDVYKNRYMAEAYEAKKWGFVPDYARLDIIYNYGGIYLDTDVEIVKSFDSLLYQEAFAGMQIDCQVALGLGFGSVPKNNIIRFLRDDYDRRLFFFANGQMNLTASPTYQTNALKKYGLQMNSYIIQKLNGINIYPTSFFAPLTLFAKKYICVKDSYSIHHYDGSWVEDSKKFRFQSYVDIYRKAVQ